MRWFAALLACSMALGLGGRATAAEDARRALFGAAFAEADRATNSRFAGLADTNSGSRFIPGQGLVRWNVTEVVGFTPAGASYVDSVRIVATGYDPRPASTLLRPGGAGFESEAIDLTYIRNWPSFVSVGAGGDLSLDITPHAGLGMMSGGGHSAEAGALVRFGAGLRDRVLRAVGVAGPPEQRSKLYLFAGASARTLDRNLTRGEGAVQRTEVPEDGYVQETRAGLGLGRGSVQALIGYTHETTRLRSLGEDRRNDHRVGLTFSIR